MSPPTLLEPALTKTGGVGGRLPFRLALNAVRERLAYGSSRLTADTCHPEANRRGSLKDLGDTFKHIVDLFSCTLHNTVSTDHEPRNADHSK
jgi:hypothetical protein